MAEDNGGVELEEFVVSGKSRVMVLGIDRTWLLKELPESAQYQRQLELGSGDGNSIQNQFLQGSSASGDINAGSYGLAGPIPRPMTDMWMGSVGGGGGEQHIQGGLLPMFPVMGPGGGPRGGMGIMGGVPRGMGVLLFHRPPLLGPNSGSHMVSSQK